MKNQKNSETLTEKMVREIAREEILKREMERISFSAKTDALAEKLIQKHKIGKVKKS